MICPDCERENDPSAIRCACGAMVGHVARRENRPTQESFADRGVPAPEKRARIREMLPSTIQPMGELRRDPVQHWKDVLNTAGLGEISYRYAREALAIIDRPGRDRSPGDDDDEAFP